MGPVGITAAVFISVAWYLLKAQGKTLDLERELNKELRTEIRALNASIHDRYIPTLTQVMAEAARLTEVTAETTRALQARKDRDR